MIEGVCGAVSVGVETNAVPSAIDRSVAWDPVGVGDFDESYNLWSGVRIGSIGACWVMGWRQESNGRRMVVKVKNRMPCSWVPSISIVVALAMVRTKSGIALATDLKKSKPPDEISPWTLEVGSKYGVEAYKLPEEVGDKPQSHHRSSHRRILPT